MPSNNGGNLIENGDFTEGLKGWTNGKDWDMEQPSKLIRSLTYDDINRATINMALQIVAADFRPRLIIPVARGGVIPAAMLYAGLHRSEGQHTSGWEMMTIFAKSYIGQSQGRRLSLDVPSHVKAQIHKGGNILIVDDIYDSGDTISAINYNLRDSRRKADIRIATLYTKDEAGPDFFGEHLTNKEEWIKFPWEQ